MRWLLAVGVLVLMAWRGSSAVSVWTSDETLWRHAYTLSPSSPRATRNLAMAVLVRGDVTEARRLFASGSVSSLQPWSRYLPGWDTRGWR